LNLPNQLREQREETIMKPASKVLVGFGMAFALSIGASPTFAQGGPIDPSVFTVDNVHPWAPFPDDPEIDIDDLDVANLGAVAEDWEPMELWSVRARCSAIVADPTRGTATALMPGVPYSDKAVPFCEGVFAWVAANKPDAPDTWDELQVALQQ
jgi:hypothetical protein